MYFHAKESYAFIAHPVFFLLVFGPGGPFFITKLFWFAGSRTQVGWVYYTSGELDGLTPRLLSCLNRREKAPSAIVLKLAEMSQLHLLCDSKYFY